MLKHHACHQGFPEGSSLRTQARMLALLREPSQLPAAAQGRLLVVFVARVVGFDAIAGDTKFTALDSSGSLGDGEDLRFAVTHSHSPFAEYPRKAVYEVTAALRILFALG